MGDSVIHTVFHDTLNDFKNVVADFLKSKSRVPNF